MLLCLLLPLLALPALAVMLAERPALAMRQLLQPLQWAAIGSLHPIGYEVVKIPPALHAKLLALTAVHISSPDVSYGGPGERLEDQIILGRSARIFMPPELQAELRETFRPLVSAFCACELASSATVGGG